MESLNEKITQFLKVSTEETNRPFSWDNGNGYGEGYGQGKALGGGSPSGMCVCSNGKDGSSKLGIKEVWGKPVFQVDDIPTIIERIHGSIAQGYIVQADLCLTPCYIAKIGNVFAHASSAKQAYEDATKKAIISECVECTQDYVNYVVNKYPDVDALIDKTELYELHNIITGSCSAGRDAFLKDNNIDLNGQLSMRDFLRLVRHSYGKERIKDIIEKYGIIIE